MDEASQLAKRLREPLVQERDNAFATAVCRKALSHTKRRLWTGTVVACASVVAFALVVEEVRRAGMAALAPALAATANHSLLVQAPLGLMLAAVALFIVGLAASRP